MVSERGLDVLRVIVKDYVASREPVGSKSIVDRHAFGVSAATIRNDMALLEEEDLIVAPHTSSGRIPTDKGYRVFVDHLADLRPLTPGAAARDRNLPRRLGGHGRGAGPHRPAAVPADPSGRPGAIPVRRPRRAFGTSNWSRSGPPGCMTVLITDTGRVEQRLIDVREELDELVVAELARQAERRDRRDRAGGCRRRAERDPRHVLRRNTPPSSPRW